MSEKDKVNFCEVNNLTAFPIDKNTFEKIAEIILSEEKKSIVGKKVSFAIVNEKEIKNFNRIYRKKDYVTDVLSFFYDGEYFLGEVIICPQKIKENSTESSFKKEMQRVAVHGVLHLLGYDHNSDNEEKEMEAKTEYYLKKL
jgi:probable rRNA maturation factor